MRTLILISSLLITSTLLAQNDGNTENRSKNTVKDSLMYNTYHLEKNKDRIEPVSPTNMFQDPNDPSTTWKDYERDLQGNIIYDKEPTNNGKVRWQDASYWSSREKQGMWEVAKLPYVNEDDVLWGTRLRREIHLKDPANIVLKMPFDVQYSDHTGYGGIKNQDEVLSGIDARKNLFKILYDAAVAGQVNVYNSRMSRQYSMDEIMGSADEKRNGVFSYVTSSPKEKESENQDNFNDDEDLFFGDAELERIDILQELTPSDVTKYIIIEDWFFDKRRSKMDVRIISITPVCEYIQETVDPVTQDVVQEDVMQEAGTFFYPEIRRLLVNHKIFNEQNMMARMSFDEYFQRRLFSSHIVKESNVYDRDISEYIRQGDQLSQLLESERIKESIRTYEHNAWEY
tara:strand:+ start:1816 stop:3015 length:1200 start_codon:yes stop_codon:yes gene_type:complete